MCAEVAQRLLCVYHTPGGSDHRHYRQQHVALAADVAAAAGGGLPG
jgi:hypothetical protein